MESPTESFDLSPGIFRPRVDIPTDMEIDRAKAVLGTRITLLAIFYPC